MDVTITAHVDDDENVDEDSHSGLTQETYVDVCNTLSLVGLSVNDIRKVS